MSCPSLDARVYELREGQNHETTVREVLALGSGNAYNKLRALESWPQLLSKYEAETDDPFGSLNEKIRVALKQKAKAQWWLETGLALTYKCGATRSQIEDAEADARTSYAALTEAKHQRTAYVKHVDDQWNAVAPPLAYPGGIVMSSVGDGCIPVYPWPSDEIRGARKTITTDFTSKKWASSPMTVIYPENTIMRFVYTNSLTTADHHERKAIIAGDHCIQVLPSTAFYLSVEDWVKSFPYSRRAHFSVIIPAA
jgi:hypothetical protein